MQCSFSFRTITATEVFAPNNSVSYTHLQLPCRITNGQKPGKTFAADRKNTLWPSTARCALMTAAGGTGCSLTISYLWLRAGDILLLDIHMGGMNGFELATRISRKGKNSPWFLQPVTRLCKQRLRCERLRLSHKAGAPGKLVRRHGFLPLRVSSCLFGFSTFPCPVRI